MQVCRISLLFFGGTAVKTKTIVNTHDFLSNNTLGTAAFPFSWFSNYSEASSLRLKSFVLIFI